MVTTLLIVLAVLIVLFWLSVMLLWWHESEAREHATLDRVAMRQVERAIRLTRRSYYAGALYTRRAFNWGNKSVARAFVHVFPKAAPLFQKHDVLAGLESGPSSYFLHSISRSKEEGEKPKIRRKKIVA
ncbi:MAG TPA: hypothetical protein VGE18_02110 [Candidatus Paceibacterota bacterium]